MLPPLPSVQLTELPSTIVCCIGVPPFATLLQQTDRSSILQQVACQRVQRRPLPTLPPTIPGTAGEMPFQPAVSGLPTAKMPTARTPQMPFTKCTGTAPTGSSIFARSSANDAKQTSTPATRPMTTAPMLLTNAHGAV